MNMFIGDYTNELLFSKCIEKGMYSCRCMCNCKHNQTHLYGWSKQVEKYRSKT